MALHPTVYADLFGKALAERDVDCWLVNTGWTGGAYPAGERIKIAYSRAVVRAAMSGALKGVPFAPDPVFRFELPQHCPGLPDELLQPRGTWDDPVAYDAKARELATLFADNFAEYAGHATPEVRAAGPVAR
jgi:phosphoenolpyruvate carboxykinase (ATP)